ncbi:hypothetical protein NWFMUON74_26630 [Nocardia wallacei]|uniref:Nudix hydrolase domain-containing protein n=1 Tax=Nocardia wallacei TaxID=480035 RepID=A0A7G1KJ07_9NOCA|nr:hypothetical protein NWFMUON74_26630 [Nocardia wallacei]
MWRMGFPPELTSTAYPEKSALSRERSLSVPAAMVRTMQQAEPGEHPLAAARREAYEELGLEAEFTGGRRAATRDGRPRR